jgi:hypothetical protein
MQLYPIRYLSWSWLMAVVACGIYTHTLSRYLCPIMGSLLMYSLSVSHMTLYFLKYDIHICNMRMLYNKALVVFANMAALGLAAALANFSSTSVVFFVDTSSTA